MTIDYESMRTGEENNNNLGEKMTIIKYNNSNDITVGFENGCNVQVKYSNFKKGEVRNLYNKNIFGLGYIGEGNYYSSIKNIHTKVYNTWIHMFQRCYDIKTQIKCPSYVGCSVAPEWHNFQIFAKWFEDNYYELDDEEIDIDKDILVKGNKIYSCDNCIIVPQRINSLFIKRKANNSLPIGVYFKKKNNKYCAQCLYKKGKNRYLGLHDTPELAFLAYKSYKETLIKQIADEYKTKYSQFPPKLYDIMYKYEVEITD